MENVHIVRTQNQKQQQLNTYQFCYFQRKQKVYFLSDCCLGYPSLHYFAGSVWNRLPGRLYWHEQQRLLTAAGFEYQPSLGRKLGPSPHGPGTWVDGMGTGHQAVLTEIHLHERTSELTTVLHTHNNIFTFQNLSFSVFFNFSMYNYVNKKNR